MKKPYLLILDVGQVDPLLAGRSKFCWAGPEAPEVFAIPRPSEWDWVRDSLMVDCTIEVEECSG